MRALLSKHYARSLAAGAAGLGTIETKTVRRIGVFLAGAWGLTRLAYGGEYGLVIEKG
ncbi:MAG: hypothetical protein ACHBMF_02960 [Chromatiales bacterium]